MSSERKDTRGTDTRQVYRKPQLRKIELVTGEVLFEGCKMNGGGLNYMDNPDCGISNNCVGSGS